MIRSGALIALVALPLAGCQTTSSDGGPLERDRSYERTLAVGEPQLRLNGFYRLDPRCRNLGPPSVRILSNGSAGQLLPRRGTGFPVYPEINPRSRCNTVRSPNIAVFYVPPRRFVGTDRVAFEVRWADGEVWRETYTIQVR